jgi:tetratricopeptide (TPR) repeat protein
VAQHTLGVAYLRVSEAQSRTGDRNAALESAEQALRVFQNLHARDATNTENQRGLAWAWIRKGEVFESAAATAPSGQRLQTWQQASGCYQQSLNLFSQIEKQKALRPADIALRQNVRSAFENAQAQVQKLHEAGKTLQL